MFRFEHPEALWALLALPGFILLVVGLLRWRKASLRAFGEGTLTARLMPLRAKGRPLARLVLFGLAYAVLVVGVANPQAGSKLQEVKREGIDLMLLLDVSNSMLAEDLQPNRLENAKRAIARMVDGLKNDRLGLVVFAGDAFVQLPMTTDYAAAKLFLNTTTTGLIPNQGTDIGNAIKLALESMDFENGASKAMVIITDGENHEPGTLKAAQQAAELGVVIHTIGMGSPGGAPIPVYRNGRQAGFRKNKAGQPIVTQLDEQTLEEIAEAGNGSFVQASNAGTGLQAIFQEIETMDKAEFGTKVFSEYEDLFPYFMAAALIILLLEFALSDKRSRRLTQWLDQPQPQR